MHAAGAINGAFRNAVISRFTLSVKVHHGAAEYMPTP
jgi:hypothetical protein